MEKWLVPKQKASLVKWLLQTAVENGWTILFEYSEDGINNLLRQVATEVTLPLNGEHHYEESCKLTAIKDLSVNDNFVKEVIRKTHVMSACDTKQMLFLFADDYHKDCLSCSVDFYNQYMQLLCDQKLVEYQ